LADLPDYSLVEDDTVLEQADKVLEKAEKVYSKGKEKVEHILDDLHVKEKAQKI